MSFRRSDWPLTPEQVQAVVRLGESTLVERKREWWDLDRSEGRAQLAREVIAFANAVGPEELGLILVGVEDERRGSGIVPVVSGPEPEALSQILAGYVHPPARFECRHYDLPDGRISVLAVLHSPSRPHYSLRESPGVLSTRDAYVRRDRQVGIMTLPELERLIREKDAVLGPLVSRDPIQFGAVSIDQYGPRRLVVRLQNVTTEPVPDVGLTFDVYMMRDHSVCYRARTLQGATLEAGETREVALDLSTASFYKTFWVGSPPVRRVENLRDRTFVGDNWFDVTVLVLFRDGDGFLQTREQKLALEL